MSEGKLITVELSETLMGALCSGLSSMRGVYSRMSRQRSSTKADRAKWAAIAEMYDTLHEHWWDRYCAEFPDERKAEIDDA